MNVAALSTEEAVMERIADWNRAYPPGTKVLYQRDKVAVQARTRAGAFGLNGEAYIYLRSIQGAVALDRVRVSPYRAWVKVARKKQVAHWVEGLWHDRQELEDELDRQRRLDDRIESIEIRNTRPSDFSP